MAVHRDMIAAITALADVDQHHIVRAQEDLVLCSCGHWSVSLEAWHKHVLDDLSRRWLTRPERRPNFTPEERAEMATTWNEAPPGLRTKAVSERYGIAPRSVSMYISRLEEAGYHIDRAGRGSSGRGQKRSAADTPHIGTNRTLDSDPSAAVGH